MKKKTLIAAAAILVLNLGVALGVKKTNMDQSPWTENIEALCDTVCEMDAGVMTML